MKQNCQSKSNTSTKKLIKSLVNMEGVMLDNQESISEEVLGVFGKLYNVGEEDLWQLEGLDWSLI